MPLTDDTRRQKAVDLDLGRIRNDESGLIVMIAANRPKHEASTNAIS